MRAPALALFLWGVSSTPLVVSASVTPAAETETSPILEQLLDLDALMRPTAARLLACGSEESFLAELDSALCRTEWLTRLVTITREIDAEALTSALDDFSARTDESVDATVTVTNTELRDELERGFADAAKIAHLLLGPEDSEFARQAQALAAYGPRELAAASIAELGSPRVSSQERRAGLAILRSNVVMFVLSVASDAGEAMPPWMAELSVHLWRQGHEQLLARHEHRPAPALREERLTPISALLLSFVWSDSDEVASILSRAPATAPLLQAIADALPRFFGADIDHLRLRPNLHADSAEDELAVDVCVASDAPGVLEALERFDEAWWLDTSRGSSAEIVVDIRRV